MRSSSATEHDLKDQIRGQALIDGRNKWGLFGAFALAVICAPSFAFAEGGGGLSETSFQTIVTLLGVVGVAFAVTHLLAEWLSRRFGVVTGVEYIVLGAISGPIGILSAETLMQVSPALVLGEGSIGLLAGILLNFRSRDSVTGRSIGLGAFVTFGTMLVVGIPSFLVLAYFFPPAEAVEFLPHVLCTTAVACVAGQGTLRSLIQFLEARGEGSQIIVRVARVCSSLAVVVFGVIFCLSKPASDLIPGMELSASLSFGVWFGVHLVLGAVLGLVFTLFLMRDFEDEKILTVVIGMVIFTSGVAYYLELSPIFVNFVLGVALANMCRQSGHVLKMLLSVEKPLYIVLFFFAGASLSLDVPIWAWTLAIPYLILRFGGRAAGGFLAVRVWRGIRPLPAMGSALLAPGALSAAMLINFQTVFADAPYVEEWYAGLLVAIVVSEPLAYRFSRRWLIDATDVAIGREPGGAP